MLEVITQQLNDGLKLLTFLGIADIVDITIVAFLIYKLIGIIRKTSTWKVARGIIVVFLALWISGALKMNVINFLLRTTMQVGLLALIVLFQPELRRILERVGSSRISSIIGRELEPLTIEAAVTQTVLACTEMSKARTGVLIVFERNTLLFEAMHSGTRIDADVTVELLKNIFYPKAPLHDGALIVRDGRIAAAGCVLPLSSNSNLSRDLGMRHRAGIGMSEQSDAVIVIVSEETGAISVAIDGMLKRHLNRDTFEAILRRELIVSENKRSKGLRKLFKGSKNDDKKSAG